MSAFYDLASLVLVPSGYKASKVYAQKPLTTDGQLTFSRASDATRVNASGLIETVSSNVPRLDYLNSSCPRLLLEPQRQNGFQFSEQADNAYWTKTNCTISANNAVSPDGYTNADKIVENTATGLHGIQSGNFTSTTGAVSVFVKAAGRTFFNISEANGAGGFYNLTTGAATGSFATASMQDYGNGWWRCVLQYTFPSAFATNFRFYVATSMSVISYAGDGSSGVLIYGAQFENGAAYATSYIPTLGAAVTRLADACSKTGISSLIGQTEGTLFLEVNFKGGLSAQPIRHLMNVSDGTDNNRVVIYIQEATTIISMYIQGSGTLSVNDGQAYTGVTTAKIALAYNSGNSAIYVNGSLAYSNSTAFAFNAALSQITVGARHTFENEVGDGVSQALLFKTRLTNAQLAELTTL